MNRNLAYNKKQAKLRDHNKCRLCFEKENLQVHHLTPKFLKGSDDVYNLITVCESCHLFLHCNPRMIMASKKNHSDRTKAGVAKAQNVGKRGRDAKPRKKRGTANNAPEWAKSTDTSEAQKRLV